MNNLFNQICSAARNTAAMNVVHTHHQWSIRRGVLFIQKGLWMVTEVADVVRGGINEVQ